MPGAAELERRVRAYRRELQAADQAAVRELVQAYSSAQRAIEAELRLLAKRIEDAHALGQETSPAWLFQQRRYGELQAAVQREMATFAQKAGLTTQQLQRLGVDLAYDHLVGYGQAQGVGAGFIQAPGTTVQDLLATTRPGGPVYQVLLGLGPDAADELRQALITSLVLGRNPQEVARAASDRLGIPMARAATIARTEMLRAYRLSSHESMKASDVVKGWVWWAAVGRRPCGSCMAMHGTRHRTTEQLDDHPNGRCTMVPDMGNAAALVARTGGTGAEQYAKLSPAEQDALLGKAKAQAIRDGRFALADLVGRRRSRTWGTMRYERSLKELSG